MENSGVIKRSSDGGIEQLGQVGLPTVVVVWLVEPTQLANGADPLVHLLLSLSYEIKSAIWGLDVKHEAVLELFPLKGQASVHLLAAVQVNDPNGFLGVVVLVVLQNIRVATHAAAAEYEPALLPCLGKTDRKGKKRTQSTQKGSGCAVSQCVQIMCVQPVNDKLVLEFFLLCKQHRYHLHLK